MTVIRPNSISGVTSITGQGGDISIFRADGTAADVTVNNITSGVITATTFSGNITGNLSGGTINATSGTVTGNLGVGGVLTYEDVTNIDSIGIITARAGINVSGGVITGDGSGLTRVSLRTDGRANTSGIITATSFVPTVGQLSHRNIIINGSFQVAQRGTTSTTPGDSFQTTDRIGYIRSGLSENTTQAQVDVTNDAGPYALGLRKSLKLTNGNNTADVAQYQTIMTKIEADDMARSGWNYTSSSSYITFSCWVKSSVAQNFYGYFYAPNRSGGGDIYPFETGSLTANTWTKIIKSVPGHTNVTFSAGVGWGLQVLLSPYFGTNYTSSGVSLNTWAAYSGGGTRTPDYTTTWQTTNDATFETTGWQLEVGPVATPFEHRSFGDELARCQRYYYMHHNTSKTGTEGNYRVACLGFSSGSTEVTGHIFFPVTMRANPSIDANSGVVGGIGYWRIGGGSFGGDKYIDGAWSLASPTTRSTRIYATPRVSLSQGVCGYIDGRNDASYMAFDAEI